MSLIDQIPKAFDAKESENRLYKEWETRGYFEGEINADKKPYSIVMPPPNITGQLHMGHALDNTLQDILIRFKKLQGYSTLWIPGTDHASIATEAKIVEDMAKENLTKDDLGREKFLLRAWKWKEQYGGRIVDQLKRLGSACDWSRERFTMDEELSQAVTKVFIDYYQKDLIYRGERIINWCPQCLTSISDAEVEYQEKEGKFYHLRYPVANSSSDEYLILATTRPETLLGDTAVAVHPEDSRYSHLIGKMVVLPLVEREIPIIADTYVDPEFGTGVVKITPAHDPNDFEVGLRHDLPIINIMTDDAKINQNGGVYEGLERYAARKKIIEDLTMQNYLIKTEDHKHNVGTCYRCATIVEPRVSFQWFVRMESLAKPAIEAVKEGRTNFVPQRFEKIYFNWMENIRDWCISRQLWWGHRIPAYHCLDCNHIEVASMPPSECSKCNSSRLKQDPDTLDTWFSSALWPFSTLGWPQNTKELNYFYPTSVLVTGYDIIFFWVARMMFSGLYALEEVPFKDVFIHGIVRDSQGRKMSKSLGNGIDPLEIIDIYGADALRYALIAGNGPGHDLRYQQEKVEAGRNFSNKIWNAMRFVIMNCSEDLSFDHLDLKQIEKNDLAMEDKWILSRLANLTLEVTNNLEKYELGIALSKIYSFLWEEYCDWYIEIVKVRLFDLTSTTRIEALYVLNFVLAEAVKLLHPFMPFITEEIYGYLVLPNKSASIMISHWPSTYVSDEFSKVEKQLNILMTGVKTIRNTKASMNVAPSKKANLIVVGSDTGSYHLFQTGQMILERLAGIEQVVFESNKKSIPPTAVALVFEGIEAYLPLEDLLDIKQELERLEKEKKQLMGEIKRIEGKLGNEGFIAKAPALVIETEKDKLTKYQSMYNNVIERMDNLR